LCVRILISIKAIFVKL